MTNRRILRLLSCTLVGLGGWALNPSTGGVSLALAQNDEEAKQLAEQALFEDYLNLNFEGAKTKLILANGLCESGCTASTRARILRDLGVVQVAGLKDRDAGIEAFIKAMGADPTIQLDPDLNSPEIRAAWKEAKQLADEGLATVRPEEPEAPAEVDPNAGVSHTPPTEQTVNTPLPLYLELDEQLLDAKVGRVRVFFRGFGMARFKEDELAEIGDGYGIELGCKEIGQSTGKMDYYLIVYDDEGSELRKLGSDSRPFTVRLLDVASTPPAPLPGTSAPEQCEMTASTGDEAAAAILNAECPPDSSNCGFDIDGDEEVGAGPSSEHATSWLSLSFQQDFLLMSALKDACSSQSPKDTSCFYSGNVERPGSQPPYPQYDVDGDGAFDDSGSIQGGFAMGTQRILLGYEHALSGNFLVGAKVGYPLGTNPVNALPVHVEARASYWLGDNVLSKSTFRPFLAISGGAAQVDAKVTTQVLDARYKGSFVTTEGGLYPDRETGLDCGTPANSQCVYSVDAWKKTGQMFAAGGVGAMLALGSNHGLLLQGRYMLLFPDVGQAIGAQAGYMVGF